MQIVKTSWRAITGDNVETFFGPFQDQASAQAWIEAEKPDAPGDMKFQICPLIGFISARDKNKTVRVDDNVRNTLPLSVIRQKLDKEEILYLKYVRLSDNRYRFCLSDYYLHFDHKDMVKEGETPISAAHCMIKSSGKVICPDHFDEINICKLVFEED